MPATLESPVKPPKWFDRYQANRVPADQRARIVDLLSNPREHISYSEIMRREQVSEGIVKAVEAQEQDTLEQRKSSLMSKSFRIADKATDRVEELIHTASLAQATVTGAIYVEKGLLLAGEPTQRIEVTINAQDIYSELRTIQAEIVDAVAKLPDSTGTVPAPVDAEFVGPALASDLSVAGMDSPVQSSPA